MLIIIRYQTLVALKNNDRNFIENFNDFEYIFMYNKIIRKQNF